MTDAIVVSYSELDTFRQCPLKHALAYGQRWTRPVKPGSALDKGSLWHAVMETHYRIIQKWQLEYGGKRLPKHVHGQVLEQAAGEIAPLLSDPQTGEQTEVQGLIDWMYQGHVDQWGVDESWIIKGVEHQIVTPLRDENGRRTRYHLKAKLDLVVFDLSTGGHLWVVDHKSGGNLPTQMDLEIDDQFGLYTWAMREVGRRVVGSLHSANRTQRNKAFMPLNTRLSRTYLNRSETELTSIALDAYRTAWNAHPPKGAMKKIHSAPDPRVCGWKCDFKEPHLLMRRGRNPHEILTEYGFKIDLTRH